MRKQRSAWNKGRQLGQKPPLKPKEIWSLRIRLQLADKARDLALFNLAIDSKLRGCDLVSLRVHDVYQSNVVSRRAIVMQRKTHRPVQFEIAETMRESVAARVAGRTKATLIYKRTKNIPAIQLLLGHTKLESTVRYLGIEVDDALEISEQTGI